MGNSRQSGDVERGSSHHEFPAESRETSLALEILAYCKNGFYRSDFYSKTVQCYDVLLHVLENPDFALKIARMANMHPKAVKECSIKIVDLLLFNSMNEPFVSLGLSRDASKDEIHRRWKRLLMLFHPDRAFAGAVDTKRTKTMNAAYQEIGTILSTSPPKVPGGNVSATRGQGGGDEFDRIITSAGQTIMTAFRWSGKNIRKLIFEINSVAGGIGNTIGTDYEKDETEYLKYIPSIIVILTAFAAVVMFSLYILQSFFSLVRKIGLG